jgi:phage tail-like protein
MGHFHTQQNLLLELDGNAVGRLFAFTGGAMKADVIESTRGGYVVNKHIASVRFQDMEFTLGAGMSRSFYNWIADSVSGSYARKNGAVVMLDFDQKAKFRAEFTNALVQEIVFPELDASSHTNGSIKVTISPEIIRSKAGDSGAKVGIYMSAMPPAWKLGRFRLSIDGLEKDCRHVTQISSLRIGQKIASDSVGESRGTLKEPGKTEFSNLTINLPEMYADGFFQWADDFLIKGNNSQSSEKTGRLEFLAASSKPYFTIEFGGLGITEVAGPSALREKTNRPLKISMYCESMKFSAEALAIR